jgi:hypothetical protein
MSTKIPGKITRKLTNNVTTYLSLKAQIARLSEQADVLKVQIDAECDLLARANQFQNGQLSIPSAGLVKVVLNPAKLIVAATEKVLTPIERVGLAKVLGEDFTVTDVNLAKIKSGIDRHDSLILAALASYGVKCVQSARYDVKPIQA